MIHFHKWLYGFLSGLVWLLIVFWLVAGHVMIFHGSSWIIVVSMSEYRMSGSTVKSNVTAVVWVLLPLLGSGWESTTLMMGIEGSMLFLVRLIIEVHIVVGHVLMLFVVGRIVVSIICLEWFGSISTRRISSKTSHRRGGRWSSWKSTMLMDGVFHRIRIHPNASLEIDPWRC